ncbi:hypothetical protein KA057_00680 [Candidatus Gracilibacteria bacterium]|nr:hypothetical protein [Candidatus Gracilibacteria bacterium]
MYLINLIGGSGSGKGYLAEKIIETFGADRVDTIPYDMYYYPDAEFPKHLYVEFEGKQFKNFDTPEALETDLLIKHIEQLKNGQEVQIPEYDFGNNPTGKSQRKPGKIVKPKDFIILDGLFGLHDPRLRKLSDVSIFIELSAVNRMARRMIRDWGRGQARSDMGEPGMADDILFYITFVQSGYHKYVESCRQYADLVVDNNEWIHAGVEPKMIDIAINYLRGKFDFQKNSIV